MYTVTECDMKICDKVTGSPDITIVGYPDL